MTLWMLSIVLAASAVEVQPPPFADVCFGDFDDAKPYPTPAELKGLLGRVANEPFEILETTKRLERVERQISHISGVFRLNVDWKPHTTLRLSLLDCQSLQLYFWNAQRGVLLKYCPPAQHSWGAYGTTRDGTGHRPKTLAGWALDGGRYCRAGRGTVEVRHHQGNIVLTRGDVQLLSAPLEGLPQEVYLEGSTLVRGISIYASGGRLSVTPSNNVPETRPLVLNVPKPAQQQWTTDLPQGATLQKRPDGAVELHAKPGEIAAQAALKVPGPALFEVIFELEEPDVGTGIYLAGEAGSPLARLGFFRDTATGATTLAFENHELHATGRSFNFARAIVPFAGRHQWVKLTVGAGVLKAWTSGDGVRFSQMIWSPVPVRGRVAQAGLYCIASSRQRSIRLRSLAVRRLDALSSLAPQSVPRPADLLPGALAEAETIEEWDRLMARARPAEVTVEDWRRACALWTLAENPYFSLGGELIHRLVRAELARGDLADPAVLDAKLRLLDEAALLIHSLDDRSCRPMQQHYERLGLRLIQAGHSNPLDVVRRAVIRTPIWNYDRPSAWPDRLLRYELLSRVAEERWPEVDRLLGSLQFWQGPDRLTERQPPLDRHFAELLEWSRFQLARHGKHSHGPAPGAIPLSWRETLIERLSKEGYNVAAEFQAAVESKAYRAACQIVANSGNAAVEGLLPDAEDPRLLGSLSVIISRAMQREPALRQAMREHFGSLGRLRLSKAVAAADAAAVEAVALQFCGTEAAAQAHRWLGDHQLSGGRPALAIGHYRLALQDVPADEHLAAAPAARDAVHARLRLAGAMLGQDVGRPVDAPVEFGAVRLTVEQFESMVRQLLRSRRQPSSTAARTGDGPDDAHQPTTYQAARWARFYGSQLKGPAADDATDWAARRIAAVVTSRQMIVGDPVALTAFDLQTGEQTWSLSRKLRESTARWPAVPMRPIVAGGQVFARRLTDSGPVMASFVAANGAPIWSSCPDDYAASDPLLVGQDLLAVTARRRPEEGTLALALVALDLRSGRVRRNAPLAEFRRGGDGDALLLAQATAADGRIVVTAAGCVICCDLTGRVQWIRRQLRIPLSTGSPVQRPLLPAAPRHEPPPVAAGLVYATQPGVWSIECLDLQTGSLVWRKAVPEMIAVIGHVKGVLVVETADGFLGLDARLGELLWTHLGSGEWAAGNSAGVESPHCPLPTPHSLDRAGVLYVSAAKPHLSLVQLDPQSGASRETPIQNVPRRNASTFGPLVVGHGRIWGLLGTAAKPSTQEIFELFATDAEPITEKNK
ncbi:MAG: PQQ-binding-like beta-propeller repeat protein [Candidatus Nealsonbacteria bacterium]|nr:PQQ-binding-like beta-propeller repeat protein [Candidatus Nealsonbacteria bacterium]